MFDILVLGVSGVEGVTLNACHDLLVSGVLQSLVVCFLGCELGYSAGIALPEGFKAHSVPQSGVFIEFLVTLFTSFEVHDIDV